MGSWKHGRIRGQEERKVRVNEKVSEQVNYHLKITESRYLK
jgi:hypothetical protein